MSIVVVRTFIRLRRALPRDGELTRWLRDLERKVEGHDNDLRILFTAIRRLMDPPERPRRRMGFDVV
jgi:hypothetical protein